MSSWEKSRNYRIVHEESGSIRFFISVDGQDIQVSKEIYNAYSQAERRERYLMELDARYRICSIDKFDEDHVPIYLYTPVYSESAEEAVVESEEREERRILLKKMNEVLHMLSADEICLMRLLFFENVSVREVARRRGVTHRAVIKRRDHILSKIKKILKISAF